MTGIIDVHSHALFPAYREALGDHSGDMALPTWSGAGHVEAMDRHGIEVAMLSVPNVDEFATGPTGADLIRRLNDGLADIVANGRTRFGGFGSVPMDDMNAALAETGRVLDELHLDGITLSPQHAGRYLGDPIYDPLLEELDRRAAVVFVHPGTPPRFDPAQPLHSSVLEFMFETTRWLTSLVLSGARQRFTRVAFIATHGGGTLPYLAHRIQLASQMPWAYRNGASLSMTEVREGFASMYYDLTAATSPEQLATITGLVGPERLLLGFDQPLMPEQTIAPALASFEQWPGLDEAQRGLVARGNALELFPRLNAPRPRT